MTNYGDKSRKDGMKYEDTVCDALNSILSESGNTFDGVDDKKKCLDIFGGKTTTKADLFDSNGCGISVKNPKASSTSIQMFIASKDKLVKALDMVSPMPQEAVEYLNLFLGETSKESHAQLCESKGISYSSLDDDQEKRRMRCFHSSIPRNIQEEFERYMNQDAVKSRLFDLVFSQGFCNQKENHASTMLWCDSSVEGKGSLNHMVLFDIDKVKQKTVANKFVVRSSNTVWELGPITLQMKGSGAKTSSGYHSPQFNASLNDILKCLSENEYTKGSIAAISQQLN